MADRREVIAQQTLDFGSGFWGRIGQLDARIDTWIQSRNPFRPELASAVALISPRDEATTVGKQVKRALAIAVTLFLIWAVSAPIGGGEIINGNVVVAGYRKAVQHEVGGVVETIAIKEGDEVRQGQILFTINPLNANANFASIRGEFINVLVRGSRLRAQAAGLPEIIWSAELAEFANEPSARMAKSHQVVQFNARRDMKAQQENSLKLEISGFRAKMQAVKIQLRSLEEELNNAKLLARDGYITETQLNQAERLKSDQDAALATAQSSIGKAEAQLAEIRSAFSKEISDEAATVQKDRQAVISKLRAVSFQKGNTAIRAPISGRIVGLNVFTIGGVISAGDVLAEVVPSDAKLVVEIQVPIDEKEDAVIGQLAYLRFTAFNIVTTPVVDGRVIAVGADRLKATPGEKVKDEEDYYLAQLEVAKGSLSKLGSLTIQPGMPVEVIFPAEERTFASYMIKAVVDKFATAFTN